jgi:hypothetical protein
MCMLPIVFSSSQWVFFVILRPLDENIFTGMEVRESMLFHWCVELIFHFHHPMFESVHLGTQVSQDYRCSYGGPSTNLLTCPSFQSFNFENVDFKISDHAASFLTISLRSMKSSGIPNSGS